MADAGFHSLRDVWQHAVEKWPRKAAYLDGGREYTYAECDRLSDRLRRALSERCGMKPGDTLEQGIEGLGVQKHRIVDWNEV